MPYADTMDDHGRLVRVLIYGKDKSKKTWWAARAAEDGYNVVLLDGDDGATIIKNIPLEARKKILVLNLTDKANIGVFCRFVATFTRGEPFLWDEQDKVSIPLKSTLNPAHSYVKFDLSKFTANDVIILDSWTALVASTLIEFARETGTDLTQIDRDGDNFALPNFQARYLDNVLNKIKTWQAHAIVVGHETNYEKGKGKGKDRKIIGDYTQPISSTGPQGQKIGKFFENVLRFYRLSDTAYRIDAGGDDSRAGGSRLLPPEIFKWENVTPQLLMEKLGSKATGEPCLGAIFIPKGSQIPVVDNTQTQTQQNNSLLSSQEILASTPANEAVPSQPRVLNGGSLSLAERIKLTKK